MKQMKRTGSLFLVLVMLVNLLSGLAVPAHAATYTYNWGTRGTVATSLSDAAEAFYEANNTSYEVLSELEGSADVNAVPGTTLYAVLSDLMEENHSYITSYADTRDLYRYTDCENGGGTISSFYSGAAIGPDWDSGKTWNREHTWPNSKGDASGEGENDIMMLRPTAKTENGSRSNKAYGTVTSADFFYPNHFAGGKYDLRGDVARIMLYVYVRWQNTERMWGAEGVIQSREVLLSWIELDPVDTWELGRNDAVQSITGTRNVFVDYPELAFVLFGEEIPADMKTPSGEAIGGGSSCQHEYTTAVTAPTCTDKGYTTYTCTVCGLSYNSDKVDALGHTYVDGTCTVCGAAEPDDMIVKLYHPSTGKYVTGTEYLYNSKKYELEISTDSADALILTARKNGDGTVTFVTTDGKFLMADGTNVRLVDAEGDDTLFVLEKTGSNYYIQCANATYYGKPQYLEVYSGYLTVYSFNSSNTDIYTFQLQEMTKCDAFGHSWVDATVTEPKTCTVCGATEGEPLGEDRTVSFVVPEGIDPVADMTCNNLGITLPAITAPEGYTFEGWVAEAVDAQTEKPALSEAGTTFETQADTVLYALFSYTREETNTGSGTAVYQLVTDASQLAAGKQVVIAGAEDSYALSTNQKNNNRQAVAVTKNSNGTLVWSTNVAELTLGTGTVSGTYTFYCPTNAGYLYAASGSDNQLKTQKTLNSNGCWAITVNGDGSCSIVAQGTNARATMQFNPNGGNALISCYASATQSPLALYVQTEQTGDTVTVTYYATTVEVQGCAHANAADVPAQDATCTDDGYTAGVYCPDCKTYLSGHETVTAPGHSFGQWTVTKEATVDAEGEKMRSCSACSETETEVIPKLEPEETQPEETQPEETEPEETQPEETKPEETEPEETEPEETQPKETEPEETKPEETQPEETEPEETEPVNPFEDVSEDKFYFAPVLWAVDKGITTGKTATQFQPDGDCTRAQIVTFLWRANGEPEPTLKENPFTDVKDTAYYYKAVLWAVEKGITTGKTATTFEPSSPCTRAQVVTFLWRAEGKPAPETAENSFPDVAQGKFYTGAVLWAVENGITAGFKDGTFRPNATCTRGQIVTFLYRAMSK